MFSFDFTNLHASGSGVLTKEPHQISYAELTGDWRLCTYRAWAEQLSSWAVTSGMVRSVRWSDKLPGDDKSDAGSHQTHTWSVSVYLHKYTWRDRIYCAHIHVCLCTHTCLHTSYTHLGCSFGPGTVVPHSAWPCDDDGAFPGVNCVFWEKSLFFFVKTLFLGTAPWALCIQMVRSYDQFC